LNEVNKIEYVNESMNLYEYFSNLEKHIKTLENNGNISTAGVSNPTIAENLYKILGAKTDVFEGNFEDCLKLPEFKKIYIPILRGMKPINFVDGEFKYEDVYNRRIKKIILIIRKFLIISTFIQVLHYTTKSKILY